MPAGVAPQPERLRRVMYDWADVNGDEGWQEGRLIAENAELADRLRRIGRVLSAMAHELAQARRDNAALRRENLRLQMLLREPSEDGQGAQAKLAGDRH